MCDIAIVDDDTLVRFAVKKILEGDNYKVVAEAGNGQTAMRMAHKRKLDIIIIDLDLPDISGIELTGRLRRLRPNLKILLLTGNQHIPTLYYALNAGIDGLLIKNSNDHLLVALNYLANNQTYIQPNIAFKLIDFSKKISNDKKLTCKEYQVFMYQNNGYSNHEIAEKLNIHPKTVSNIKSRLKTNAITQQGSYFKNMLHAH